MGGHCGGVWGSVVQCGYLVFCNFECGQFGEVWGSFSEGRAVWCNLGELLGNIREVQWEVMWGSVGQCGAV